MLPESPPTEMSALVLLLCPKATQSDPTAPYACPLSDLLGHVISVLYRPLHLPWTTWLPTSSSHCSLSVGRLYSDNIPHEKSRCFLITVESSWTHSPQWGSYLAHRSLFSGSVRLSPTSTYCKIKHSPRFLASFPFSMISQTHCQRL